MGGGGREGGEREKVGVRVDEAKNHVQMNLSTWRERERGGGGGGGRERNCESRGNNRMSIIRFRFQIQCISLEWRQEGCSGERILVNSAHVTYMYLYIPSFLPHLMVDSSTPTTYHLSPPPINSGAGLQSTLPQSWAMALSFRC